MCCLRLSTVRETGCEGFLLLRSRELGDQQSVANGDLVFQKCVGYRRYQVSESNATVLCCLCIYVPTSSLRAQAGGGGAKSRNITKHGIER